MCDKSVCRLVIGTYQEVLSFPLGDIAGPCRVIFQKYVFVEAQIHGLPSQTMFEAPSGTSLSPLFYSIYLFLQINNFLFPLWVYGRFSIPGVFTTMFH